MELHKGLFVTALSIASAGFAADQLIVSSHEADPSSGSLVSFDEGTLAPISRTTGAFKSPNTLLLNYTQDQILSGAHAADGIKKYDFTTGELSDFAPSNQGIAGMIQDHCGNTFVSEILSDTIRVYNPQKVEIFSFNMLSNSQPQAMVFDNQNRLLIASQGRSYIPRYNLTYDGCNITSATTSSFIPVPSCNPNGLAQDSALNLYVSCNSSPFIKKFNAAGDSLGNWATSPTPGPVFGNQGLLWHNNHLYLANRISNVVYKFSSAGGAPVATIGSGHLLRPRSVVAKKEIPPVAPSHSLSRAASGEVTMDIKANPNQSIKIQVSSDLSNPNGWADLQTVTTDALGNFSFTDSDAPNYSKRFYRVAYSIR